MADVIKCPSCGENNPAGIEFCQFCQTKLTPPTGNLKGRDESIKPGQLPTRKNTAELEPILPQWLRDVRKNAQQDNDQPEDQQLPPQTDSRTRPVQSNDLLAGLQSQGGNNDDEDETPDWLANITGVQPKDKAQADSSDVRWVELGSNEQGTVEDEEIPEWLEDLKVQEAKAAEQNDSNEWMNHNLESSTQPEGDSGFMGDKPAWMKEEEPSQPELTSMDSPDTQQEIPDWLKGMDSGSSTPAQSMEMPGGSEPGTVETSEPAFPSDEGLLDWMSGLDGSSASDQSMEIPGSETSGSIETGEPALFSNDDLPDWMKGTNDSSEPTQNAEMTGGKVNMGGLMEPDFSSNNDMPDWMKGMGDTEEQPQAQASTEEPPQSLPLPKTDTTPAWLRKKDPDTKEVPAWLSSQDTLTPPSLSPDATPSGSGTSDEMPDWLKVGSGPVQRDELVEETPEPVQSADTPDWLNSMQGDTIDVDTFPMPRTEESSEPALNDLGNAGFDGSTGNLESLFSDTPDWLSNVSGDEYSSSIPDAISKNDAISPGELPSWVQAMRPVDGGLSSSLSSAPSDQTLESRGALAGLQGVLPAAPGFMPTSKPKAYSIKLQATEEHLAHATLLEQILAAETEPVPISSFSALSTSQYLRWFLTAIVMVLVIFPFFSANPIFALPSQYSSDFQGALNITQVIPESGPVLVAMDYEPARVGEMESAAAPMLDQMILLRHPYLTFIASNETGSMLAERLITGPLAEHGYQRGIQYLNLGYLPGGQMGIRAFAQNPRVTSPMDINFSSAWTGTPLESVASLSNFAAIILITDDAESARIWIEQTQSIRGIVPFVVVSSAQAAPMIRPYFDSRQISGQVAGLYGGAIFEQYNNGRPGTAASYWDSYSLGMLLAMVLIFGGGLWNLFLGLRDRAAEKEFE